MDPLTPPQVLSHHHRHSLSLTKDVRRCSCCGHDVLGASSVGKIDPPDILHHEPEEDTLQLSTCSQCGGQADQTYSQITRATNPDACAAPVKRGHHTKSYSQKFCHNYHLYPCSRKFHGEAQVVVVRRCLLILLLLLPVVLVVVRAAPRFTIQVVPDSGKDERSAQFQAGSLAVPDLGDRESRRVLEHTASLLPALAAYYHSYTINIHQPNNNDIALDQQIWHFKSVQRYKIMPSVDILLHTSVEKWQLIVHSRNGSKTIYNLLNFKSARQNSFKDIVGKENILNFENNTINTTFGEWRVTDVTKYLTDWVLDFSELSVEFIKSTMLHDVRHLNQQDIIPQPVLCVREYDIEQSTEGDRIKATLNHFMASKVVKIMRNGLSLGNNKATGFESGSPGTRYKRIRRGTSGECQVSKVWVSMEELGLRQVVYPINLQLKFCLGSCHVLDHPTIFSTNALLRAKFKFQGGSSQVPAPHCTPIHYQYQSFFVWQDDHLKKIKVSDLDATSCGCR